MILVDTSILVSYQRKKDAKLLALIRTLSVGISGITRAEMRHGIRNPSELSDVETILAAFNLIPIADHVWDDVGTHLAALRANGFTFPFPDVVIASVAIDNAFELWTRDNHFQSIQKVLPALRLYQEPP